MGKRRETNWQAMADNAITEFDTSITTRGFTGHEQIDAVGLVHMNGRVYEPTLGRFLSADPIVEAIDNLQTYNRYSYVRNNPVTLTDPTGFQSADGDAGDSADSGVGDDGDSDGAGESGAEAKANNSENSNNEGNPNSNNNATQDNTTSVQTALNANDKKFSANVQVTNKNKKAATEAKNAKEGVIKGPRKPSKSVRDKLTKQFNKARTPTQRLSLVKEVIKEYKLDLREVREIFYKHKLKIGHKELAGWTSPDNDVYIGRLAFHSLASLVATIDHEFFHTEQKRGTSDYANEVEAYQHTIDNAKHYGLSNEEVGAYQSYQAGYKALAEKEKSFNKAFGDFPKLNLEKDDFKHIK